MGCFGGEEKKEEDVREREPAARVSRAPWILRLWSASD